MSFPASSLTSCSLLSIHLHPYYTFAYLYDICDYVYLHVIVLMCLLFCWFRMNKLNTLPRGFGAFPALEVLDLTYNNLNENSLPGNFFGLSMFIDYVIHVVLKNAGKL